VQLQTEQQRLLPAHPPGGRRSVAGSRLSSTTSMR
jgi:hypothetical protein